MHKGTYWVGGTAAVSRSIKISKVVLAIAFSFFGVSRVKASQAISILRRGGDEVIFDRSAWKAYSVGGIKYVVPAGDGFLA